jgi:unspecific monooxygenase
MNLFTQWSFPLLASLGIPLIILKLNQEVALQDLKKLPSPPKHWLFGHSLHLLAALQQKKLVHWMFEWAQALGPMYLIWNRIPIVVLSKPKVIESTIITGMKQGTLVRSRRTVKAWNDIAGPILLGQQRSEWQWRRKAWNPEFSSSQLSQSQYLDAIKQSCCCIIDKITTTTHQGSSIPIDPLFTELTMRIISYFVFGIPLEGVTAEGPPLDPAKVYEATSILSYRFLRVATSESPWIKYLPTQASQDYWAAIRYLKTFLLPRIDLALQMRDPKFVEQDSVSQAFRNSMLVHIALKEPHYTRETLFSESLELLIAGTDTTAHTLSFAVGELALHSDIFAQAQALVDDVWQNQGGITAVSLKDLTYLRAIVKETLRLYPVASGSTSLEAVENTVIEGIRIPRGARIFWSMLAAGRDPEEYPNPERFWPERWLTPDPPLLLTFGSGYHRCLGEHLAMLEATIMLAYLLRHFNWTLDNAQGSFLDKIAQNLLLYPSDGMPIRFTFRNEVR